MSRRYALRDDQWERIKDIVPGRDGSVGVTAKDNRLFVEAVLYRYRAGIPPAFAGAGSGVICRNGLGIFAKCIHGSAGGPKQASGRRFSTIWPPGPTPNMP
jgi:transposase